MASELMGSSESSYRVVQAELAKCYTLLLIFRVARMKLFLTRTRHFEQKFSGPNPTAHKKKFEKSENRARSLGPHLTA